MEVWVHNDNSWQTAAQQNLRIEILKRKKEYLSKVSIDLFDNHDNPFDAGKMKYIYSEEPLDIPEKGTTCPQFQVLGNGCEKMVCTNLEEIAVSPNRKSSRATQLRRVLADLWV